MFICICNSLTDRQIRSTSGEAGCSIKTVYERLGVKPKCGRCVPFVKALITNAFDSDSGSLSSYSAVD
jgi:bacterioferritin-associated ferredoxin